MTRPTARPLTALALEAAIVETKTRIVATLTATIKIEIGVAQTKIKIAHANVGTATRIDTETEKTEIELIAVVETTIARLGTTVVKETEETDTAAGMILETTNAAKKGGEKMKMTLDQMENVERKIEKALLETQGVRGRIAPRILTGENTTGIGTIAQTNPSILTVKRKLVSTQKGESVAHSDSIYLGRRASPTYASPSEPVPEEEGDSEQRSVFVSQLAARLTARDLGYFFEDKLGEGAVRDARIVTDRLSRRSKG
jgi:hypothetical protein